LIAYTTRSRMMYGEKTNHVCKAVPFLRARVILATYVSDSNISIPIP
jgi:hypothetical protein